MAFRNWRECGMKAEELSTGVWSQREEGYLWEEGTSGGLRKLREEGHHVQDHRCCYS